MWTVNKENGVERRCMSLYIKKLDDEDFSATYSCNVKNPLGTDSHAMSIGRFDTPRQVHPPPTGRDSITQSSSQSDIDRDRRRPGVAGGGSSGETQGPDSDANTGFDEYSGPHTQTILGDAERQGGRTGDLMPGQTTDNDRGYERAQPLQTNKTGTKGVAQVFISALDVKAQLQSAVKSNIFICESVPEPVFYLHLSLLVINIKHHHHMIPNLKNWFLSISCYFYCSCTSAQVATSTE